MGMYTCLFGKVKFKEDIAQKAKHLDTGFAEWQQLLNTRRLKKHPDVITFLTDQRVFMVANGGSAYFSVDEYPDQQHVLKGIPNDAESARRYLPNKRELTFFCSLKNYTDSIEKFLRILPLIADDWDVYSQYEEMQHEEEPDHHTPPRSQGNISPNVKVTFGDGSTITTRAVVDEYSSEYNFEVPEGVTSVSITELGGGGGAGGAGYTGVIGNGGGGKGTTHTGNYENGAGGAGGPGLPLDLTHWPLRFISSKKGPSH